MTPCFPGQPVPEIHREKVNQQLCIVVQMLSTFHAGLSIWFKHREILICTCLVSDTISINICYYLLSEAEYCTKGTADWSSWAVLTQFYLQIQSLELRERSNFMIRGSRTPLQLIMKCFPLKHWKLRALFLLKRS